MTVRMPKPTLASSSVMRHVDLADGQHALEVLRVDLHEQPAPAAVDQYQG